MWQPIFVILKQSQIGGSPEPTVKLLSVCTTATKTPSPGPDNNLTTFEIPTYKAGALELSSLHYPRFEPNPTSLDLSFLLCLRFSASPNCEFSVLEWTDTREKAEETAKAEREATAEMCNKHVGGDVEIKFSETEDPASGVKRSYVLESEGKWWWFSVMEATMK